MPVVRDRLGVIESSQVLRVGSPEECPCCEYPRRGLPDDARCPECGFTVMSGAPFLCWSSRRKSLQFTIVGGLLFVIITPGLFLAPRPLGSVLILATLLSLLFLFGVFWSMSRIVWAVSWDGVAYIQGRRVSRITPWPEVDTLQIATYAEPSAWRDGSVQTRRKPGDLSLGEFRMALGSLIEWGQAKAEGRPFPGRLCPNCVRPMVTSATICAQCGQRVERFDPRLDV